MGMTNKEAVETIRANYPPENYSMLRDALDLALSAGKGQEAVEPILVCEGRNKYYNYYVCPRCDNDVDYEQNYCSECGVWFLWKEQASVKDENSHRRPAYICDPAKNTSCTKEGCMIFHYCRCTTNKKFAKTGESNKPIIAVRSDMEE